MGGNPKYAETTVLPSQDGRVGVNVTPFVQRAQQPWAANVMAQPAAQQPVQPMMQPVQPAGRAASNDGTAATNTTRDATYDGAYATGKHDGTAAAI